MNEKAQEETKPEIDLDLQEAAMEEADDLLQAAEAAEGAAPESEVDQLKQQLADSEKKALIAVADLENYRKRASKNAQEQIKYASLDLMSELLEAVDNLNRAIESAATDSANDGLLQGVKMVSDHILNILKNNHCQPIECVGEPFDPNFHQAVQMQPSNEYPANTVMQELRTGYRLHDRVIRPSQVFVSTGQGNESESTE